jgi:hypothetical protein
MLIRMKKKEKREHKDEKWTITRPFDVKKRHLKKGNDFLSFFRMLLRIYETCF